MLGVDLPYGFDPLRVVRRGVFGAVWVSGVFAVYRIHIIDRALCEFSINEQLC